MAFLGGSFIPLSVLPSFFKGLSKLTVNGLTMNALLLNMQGFELKNYSGDLVTLFIMGFVFISIAVISYSRKGKKHESSTLASA
jgi:ABC-2 type transport system permease protein